ncbi:MAG: ribonuclease HI family protein [Patescibacteria group bacterium]|nr:ribonuclease HI family protein [Patescibacteria group bacterium]
MEKIIVYIDGGSRGNPGPAAFGILISNEKGNIFKKYSQYLGKTTNNEAEYQGLIFALKKLKALFGKEKIKKILIEVRSDSELLIKQMKGEYKILNPYLQSLFLKSWNLKIDFPHLKFSLIPRQENKEADKLVQEVLNIEAKTQKLL